MILFFVGGSKHSLGLRKVEFIKQYLKVARREKDHNTKSNKKVNSNNKQNKVRKRYLAMEVRKIRKIKFQKQIIRRKAIQAKMETIKKQKRQFS